MYTLCRGLGKSGPEEGAKPSAQEAHGGKEGRLGAGSSNDFNQVGDWAKL
jgi:hypothetical protein